MLFIAYEETRQQVENAGYIVAKVEAYILGLNGK